MSRQAKASNEQARRPSSSDASRSVPAGRRYAVGAEIQPGGVHFRVWAPRRKRVEAVEETASKTSGGRPRAIELTHEEEGYFSGILPQARAGMLYRFRLDGGDWLYPDPSSRFQPEGPHGPSEVIDPTTFRWTDDGWMGVGREGQVIYEMHIGTYTPEGTWVAATGELPALAELGVTVIELMPVADFPGRFGWGYDGVDLFAPTRLYGRPDDFRAFVDRAHGLGLGVILDVVYNHFGPDGNYLKEFAESYFTDRYKNEWSEAINFDGPDAGPVREFFMSNAQYWIDEFHLDGLRLDATQQIFDNSEEHILLCIGRRVRQAARGRKTLIVAENEPQEARLVRSAEQGGYGLDAMWNDDFHHTALVALTGHKEAYYSDYLGSPQEFISAVKWGFLYQGQRYSWQKKPRGTAALDVHPSAFVTYLENHDQVANSARGERRHRLTSPGRCRALTTLLLLGPNTPLLFQGQEFAASTPFLFFADHREELAKTVKEGRAKFLAQFPRVALPEVQAALAPPSDPRTFERSKLDLAERERHAGAYALHRDLLKRRRDDPVFRNPRARGVDGAVLSDQAFVLRFFGGAEGDRLLVINLGYDLRLEPVPEPLLAPPASQPWQTAWSSEDWRYGGSGTPAVLTDDGWHLPGETAVLLLPRPSGKD